MHCFLWFPYVMPLPLEIVLLVKFLQITRFMVVSYSCPDPDHLWRSLNLFLLNEWLLDFDLLPHSDSESCLKQDFLSLDTTDIWGQKLFVVGGCSMHCGLLSWIPGLNLLYVSSTLLVVITKNVSRLPQCPVGAVSLTVENKGPKGWSYTCATFGHHQTNRAATGRSSLDLECLLLRDYVAF